MRWMAVFVIFYCSNDVALCRQRVVIWYAILFFFLRFGKKCDILSMASSRASGVCRKELFAEDARRIGKGTRKVVRWWVESGVEFAFGLFCCVDVLRDVPNDWRFMIFLDQVHFIQIDFVEGDIKRHQKKIARRTWDWFFASDLGNHLAPYGADFN